MKIFNDLVLQFEQSNWIRDPQLALIDTLLVKHPELYKFIVKLNKIAINEDLEDIQKIRQDSTVIKTNIHYPINSSLIWDCIKESHRLLTQLKKEIFWFPNCIW